MGRCKKAAKCECCVLDWDPGSENVLESMVQILESSGLCRLHFILTQLEVLAGPSWKVFLVL